MKKKRYRILFAAALVFCAAAIFLFARTLSDNAKISQADRAIDLIIEQVITYDDNGDNAADDPLARRIDFETLLDINGDVAFWLYIPDTPIDYPVMVVSDGSGYYLYHDINGDTGSWGSLFMYESSYESDMPIVYGHHVTGYEPAFGELGSYTEQGYAEEHSAAYVYLPDGSIEVYDLYAVLDTSTSDKIYRSYYFKTAETGELTDDWIGLTEHISSTSVFENSAIEDPQDIERLLVLSTCKTYATLYRYSIIFNRTEVITND